MTTLINATQFLRNEMKIIRGLFNQREAIKSRGSDARDSNFDELLGGITREVFMTVEILGILEDEVFHPMLRSQGEAIGQIETTEIEGWIEKARDAHREFLSFTRELSKLQGRQDYERFEERFAEFQADVELHFEEFDREVLTVADRLSVDQLLATGAELQERKDELLKRPEFQTSKAEVVQNPSGGEQKRRPPSGQVA